MLKLQTVPIYIFAVVLTLTSIAGGQATAFDTVVRSYTPYMDANDPLAMPLKINSLGSVPYKFWRGSKDLYFAWCKTHAQDWMADKDNWITSHGDIHFGNIGTYASDGKFGALGFGLVDFDDVCRSPMQIEIMQGWITLRLTARQQGVLLPETRQIELFRILIEAYQRGAKSDRNASQLLADEPKVRALFEDQAKPYSKGELKKVAPEGKFVPAVLWKKPGREGEVKNIYRPAIDRADEFAAGIEQAIANSAGLKSKFRYADRKSIRAAIKDIAQRTRVDSSGSQGLKKYVILLEKPLKDVDHDLVLYLKQEIPSSAERAGLSPRESRSPGQRVAEDSAAMTDPQPYLNSWCDNGPESYWVTFKEPWSNELSADDFSSYDDLKTAATIWGVVTGVSHQRESNAAAMAARLTESQVQLIRDRADAYLQQLDVDFSDFTRDPRTAEMRERAVKELARRRPSH